MLLCFVCLFAWFSLMSFVCVVFCRCVGHTLELRGVDPDGRGDARKLLRGGDGADGVLPTTGI